MTKPVVEVFYIGQRVKMRTGDHYAGRVDGFWEQSPDMVIVTFDNGKTTYVAATLLEPEKEEKR